MFDFILELYLITNLDLFAATLALCSCQCRILRGLMARLDWVTDVFVTNRWYLMLAYVHVHPPDEAFWASPPSLRDAVRLVQ